MTKEEFRKIECFLLSQGLDDCFILQRDSIGVSLSYKPNWITLKNPSGLLFSDDEFFYFGFNTGKAYYWNEAHFNSTPQGMCWVRFCGTNVPVNSFEDFVVMFKQMMVQIDEVYQEYKLFLKKREQDLIRKESQVNCDVYNYFE